MSAPAPSPQPPISNTSTHLLANTKPETVKKAGQPETLSKAKFTVEGTVEEEARARIDALLTHFQVYPELDLEALGAFL